MDVSTVVDATTTVLSTASSVVGVSAFLAAALPKPSTNTVKIYKLFRVIVDFIGANWINAKNQQ